MQNAFLLLIGIALGVIISLLIFKSLFKKDEIEKKLKYEIEAEMKIQFKENLDLELSKALKEQVLQKDKMEEEMKFKLTQSLENEISKALNIQLNQKVNIEELKKNVKYLEESIKEFKSKEIQLNSKDKKNNNENEYTENEKEIKEHKVKNFETYKANANSKENNITKIDNSTWIKDKIINSKIEHLVMLVVRKGNNFGSKIQLQKNINTTIGKADNNMVIISENNVSSTHAIIKSDEKGHFIQDLKSSTGTYVNENLIQEPKLLQNGDVIRIGDTEFIFCKII